MKFRHWPGSAVPSSSWITLTHPLPKYISAAPSHAPRCVPDPKTWKISPPGSLTRSAVCPRSRNLRSNRCALVNIIKPIVFGLGGAHGGNVMVSSKVPQNSSYWILYVDYMYEVIHQLARLVLPWTQSRDRIMHFGLLFLIIPAMDPAKIHWRDPIESKHEAQWGAGAKWVGFSRRWGAPPVCIRALFPSITRRQASKE